MRAFLYAALAMTSTLAGFLVPAGAQTGRGYLLAQGAPFVALSRTVISFDEGMRLMKAGVQKTNPKLFAREMTRGAACVVPNGTPAVVMHTVRSPDGWEVREVLVVEGERSGCRGYVPLNFWAPGNPPAAPGKEEKS